MGKTGRGRARTVCRVGPTGPHHPSPPRPVNRDTPFPGATLALIPAGYAWADFPIPGHTGDLRAAVLNRDLALGPVMAAMRMAPGSRIPAHYYERTAEAFLVLEGQFVNAGETYGPGAFFAIRPGDVHGPHETPSGCTLLFVQPVEVDPTDFHIAE